MHVQTLTVEDEAEIEITEAPAVVARRCGVCRELGHNAKTCPERKRVTWTKVTAPQPWRPTKAGEELIGYYAGRTVRSGQFGPYDVAMIIVPGVGAMTVSGTKPLSAIEASGVQLRTPIKLVFNGRKDVGREHQMKDIDVYVDEAYLAPITELPEIAS